MTGKEAIHAVRVLTHAQVLDTMKTTTDRMLLKVCRWRIHDRRGWKKLLWQMKLVDPNEWTCGNSSRRGHSSSIHGSITYAELRRRAASQ